MFRPRELFLAGQGSGSVGGPFDGAAALSHDQVLDTVPADPRDSVSGRLRTAGQRLVERIEAAELAHDLAENIGSARWFRGFGTMLGLAFAAFSLWPGFDTLQAATIATVDDATRDEFRSQMIMPLAFGGDSGRRMAATDAVVPLKAAPERPRIELVATLARGDSFTRMLQRAGVGGDEAARVAALIDRAIPLNSVSPGTKVDLVLGKRPAEGGARKLESLSFRPRFDLALSVRENGGALTLQPRPIRVDTTPLRIRGVVGASLYRSARAAGAPLKAVQQYLRTLDSQLRIDGDIAPEDQFDIILSFKRAATGEMQAGDLLYAGLEGSGKPKAQLLRWGSGGQFYEASGLGEQRSGLLAPVSGRITSGFGLRRHPILGYTRLHAGTDFGAPYGSPIYAVSDGTVTYAGRHGGHGNYVRINHGGGFGTGYAHMSRIAVGSGAMVRRGQVIGYVGSTGLSTGPHLHYEVYRNGQVVNPASVQFVMRASLSGPELEAFRSRLAQLRQIPAGTALKPVAAPAPQSPRIALAGN